MTDSHDVTTPGTPSDPGPATASAPQVGRAAALARWSMT